MKPRCFYYFAVVLTTHLLVACSPGAAPGAAPPTAVAVGVRVLQPQDIQDVLTLDGVVAPSQSANLVARVAGVLQAIHFRDGERVRRGRLLFTLEQASYREQVTLNQARLAQARSDYDRQAQLLKENASSQAGVDVALSNLQQAEANLKLAQINLGYTEIRAPFDGVMGRRVVDVGNYVGATAGGTVLGSLMQIAPAYVNAAVGERVALRLRQRAGPGARGQPQGISVRAQLQNDSSGGEAGTLDFVDRQFTAGTGTLAVRGHFANSSFALVPGAYARLFIDLGLPRSALWVPRAAVLSDQQGEFVYVVDEAQTARRRKVVTAAAAGEHREVLSGLAASDRLVVSGYAKLSDGQQVRPGSEAPK